MAEVRTGPAGIDPLSWMITQMQQYVRHLITRPMGERMLTLRRAGSILHTVLRRG